MKNVWMFLILVFFGVPGEAQLKGFSLGPYAEFGFPTGNFEESNKNGIGAGFNADVRLGKIGITGSAGFIHFGGKSVSNSSGHTNFPAINAFPIRAGLKYRVVPLLYLKVETGVVKYTNDGGSAVIFSPGLGLRLLGLDVQAKYESWIKEGNRSFWGVKAGFNF
jgi:hypothetical protein